MAVIEIQARTMLATIRQPDDLFGLDYNLNLYRGCQHQCIYCDSRSACYGIENFTGDVLVKVNAPELLARELPRKRRKGMVGTGSMNDPYMPLERHYRLARRALELIAQHGFGAHIITKSDLALRDADLLTGLGAGRALVSFSISTADDDLARKLEPGAPPPSARFAAVAALAARGVMTGVCLMPVLPFLTDTPENIRAVVEQAAGSGATYILPWFGMSLRDRQRDYYYAQLDRLFPELRARYERAFGERYGCSARSAGKLAELFAEQCARRGLVTRLPPRREAQPRQPALF